MANQLTVRGVSEEVKERLEILSRSRGQSVNATLLEIIKAAVGVEGRRRRLAGGTTSGPEDLADFEKAFAAQRTIEDPRRVQEAIAEKERLYRAYELMAAEEAGADVEGYFAVQAETLLGE